ncbi:hypothetical protein [Hugenholtzia roseola]|uniref:hypothetical protein n=1 Tax=Hugenholtzia roseola TaxID=1002 RepID=UPI0003FCF56C|nr:hypothetical protein [Hugenholtzia roseola]
MNPPYATFDNHLFPIQIVTFAAHDPTEEEFDQYLKQLAEIFEKKKPFVRILDASKVKYLASNLRIKQGKWIKEHNELLKTYSLGTAYVIPSTMLQFLLKAIWLVSDQTNEKKVFSTLQDAKLWAEGQLKKAQP